MLVILSDDSVAEAWITAEDRPSQLRAALRFWCIDKIPDGSADAADAARQLYGRSTRRNARCVRRGGARPAPSPSRL